MTYKGKPLDKGVVRFEPEVTARMASGNLQADGTYVLSTLKEGDGVVAGTHKVYVTGVDTNLAKDRAFKKYCRRTDRNSRPTSARRAPSSILISSEGRTMNRSTARALRHDRSIHPGDEQ